MGTGIDLFLDWENGIWVAGTGIWPLGTGNEVLKNGNGIEVINASRFPIFPRFKYFKIQFLSVFDVFGHDFCC
jgi:hypothetical protein